ncbi:MAG: hypothetical protein ACLTGI_06120 [Hoylesella buccalis]
MKVFYHLMASGGENFHYQEIESQGRFFFLETDLYVGSYEEFGYMEEDIYSEFHYTSLWNQLQKLQST